MVKYEYDIEVEGFRRVDRRGRILPINITEARRIASLIDLGWGVEAIHNKMVYTQQVSKTTTRSFIKNYKEGNINLDGDYPAPVKVMEHMDTEAKLKELEERVNKLENIVLQPTENICDCKKDNWKNLWGRL